MRKITCVLLFLFALSISFGQDDTSEKKRFKVLPTPSLGYSPETRFFFGGVALFTFRYKDTLTRASNAKIKYVYTVNKQHVLDANWNIFLKREKWYTQGAVHYSRYPDLYYGIGSETPLSNETVFNANRFRADLNVLKSIGKRLFIGPLFRLTEYSNLSAETNSLQFPELTNAEALAVGVTLLKDSRNSILTPIKGFYLNASPAFNFSTSNYMEALLDFRYYKTWKKKYTLASRFANDLNFGTPPFFDYAFLGGDQFVRGYYFGRYRDNHLSTIQTEFRAHVFWRIGFTAFGGLSNIYAPERPFQLTQTKFNAGLGFRFLMDKDNGTNLRIDYSIGNDQNYGVYISFGESF